MTALDADLERVFLEMAEALERDEAARRSPATAEVLARAVRDALPALARAIQAAVGADVATAEGAAQVLEAFDAGAAELEHVRAAAARHGADVVLAALGPADVAIAAFSMTARHGAVRA